MKSRLTETCVFVYMYNLYVDVRWSHAQPHCVAPRGFHNKVSIVPESPSPEVSVRQKFEIQIQIPNRFFCNRFYDNYVAQNVVRKHLKFEIWV